uniref:Ig-like domain-containing protein n=1 Tax=Crocodylus porosus TaxID=8502 RepID=A0A7M4FHW4_CROPO
MTTATQGSSGREWLLPGAPHRGLPGSICLAAGKHLYPAPASQASAPTLPHVPSALTRTPTPSLPCPAQQAPALLHFPSFGAVKPTCLFPPPHPVRHGPSAPGMVRQTPGGPRVRGQPEAAAPMPRQPPPPQPPLDPASPSLQPPAETLTPASAPPPAGANFSVSCKAKSAFPDMTLMYWLANRSFVEKLLIHVSVCRKEPVGTGVVLQRELRFKAFSEQDLSTWFMCVVKSPAGLATATLQWQPATEEAAGTEGPGWDR